MAVPTNAEIARALHEIAVLTELDEGERGSFRARAYHNAVRAVEGQARPLADLDAGELTAIKGIGDAIAAKIVELVETGRIARLEQLRERYPPGYVDLVRIPGIGPKTLQLLDEHLDVRTVDDLREAIAAERVRDVPGLGARTEEKIAEAIERLGLHGKERRTPIADALPVAEGIVASLSTLDEVERVAHAGSLRRFRETVADIDIVAAAADHSAVTAAFTGLSLVREVLVSGETKTSVLTARGMQVDLRVVDPSQWGAAMVYFTGSQAHNIRIRERAVRRGWSLNEYGLTADDERLTGETEQEVYAALDLDWIPPGMREDTGEIEATEEGRLPDPPTVDDLRGDCHVHTDLSGDGRASLAEMVDACRERGLAYVTITDHGEDLRLNGVGREAMRAQREEITALAADRGDISVLHGCELNIGPDGGLDYDDRFLTGFDWCVASVHSHFDLDEVRQTERLLAAIAHPAVNVIGHLQGRRIGKRPGIDLHVPAVLDACAETGTAIEINSHLDRLDASAEVLRAAVERGGVVFTISSDAHRVAELENVRHGVRQAERGWVDAAMVVNTWPRDRFVAWAGVG